MYFLRRRHGRKPHSEARRDPSPAEAPARNEPHARNEAPYLEPDQVTAVRPTVITKPKRPRVATPAEGADCKPAGTFRAGTLHLDRPAEQARHGKL